MKRHNIGNPMGAEGGMPGRYFDIFEKLEAYIKYVQLVLALLHEESLTIKLKKCNFSSNKVK